MQYTNDNEAILANGSAVSVIEKSTIKPAENRDKDCITVIEYLNEVAGKKFRTDTASHHTLILKLFNKGYSVDQLKAVVDLKTKEWNNNDHWSRYLRPSSLFDAYNFHQYLKTVK